MDRLEICKMLTLSTAHISKKTASILKSNSPVVSYEKGRYGWFIYFGESDQEHLPEDLARVIGFTRSCGCDWLCLDRDGEIATDLLVYDWDDTIKTFQR